MPNSSPSFPPSSSPETIARWRAHVSAWERSGLGSRAYADAHGIGASTLLAWRRRLRTAAASAASPTPSKEVVARLVPVTVEAPAFCELLLGNGRALRFPATLDPSRIAALAAALESR